MSFIAKNPLTLPEVESSPSVPQKGTRGLFAGKDGWYIIDSDGNVNKLTVADEINSFLNVVEISEKELDEVRLTDNNPLFYKVISASSDSDLDGDTSMIPPIVSPKGSFVPYYVYAGVIQSVRDGEGVRLYQYKLTSDGFYYRTGRFDSILSPNNSWNKWEEIGNGGGSTSDSNNNFIINCVVNSEEIRSFDANYNDVVLAIEQNRQIVFYITSEDFPDEVNIICPSNIESNLNNNLVEFYICLGSHTHALVTCGAGGWTYEWIPASNSVSSVNGRTGEVQLTASDMNAYDKTETKEFVENSINSSHKHVILPAINSKADMDLSNVENEVFKAKAVEAGVGGENGEVDLSDYYTRNETDAKIAEETAEIREDLFEPLKVWKRLEQDAQWLDGYYFSAHSSNSSYKYTHISVVPGDVITYENVARTPYAMRFVDAYNGDTRVVEAANNASPTSYTVPEGVDNIYVSVMSSVVNSGNYKLYITRVEDTQAIRGLKGLNSYVFRNGAWTAEADELVVGTELVVVENVDNKKNHAYDVYAEFSNFDSMTIAHGTSMFQSAYMVIDSTYVKTYHCNSSTGSLLMDTFEHGLTFDSFISVHIDLKHSNRGLLHILTNGGEYSVDTAYFGGCRNQISVKGTHDMTRVKASYIVRDVYTDTWIFGDSYTAINDPAKFPQHLISKGYTNFLISGYGGAGSAHEILSLYNLIKTGSPKRLCWCLGMNDGDTSTGVNSMWNTILNEVMNICNNEGIELILTTIPNVPTIRHDYKNEIVRNSGYRYIDFAKAVNAESVGASWYDGMLSTDGVHPTESGAKALANRLLLDVPELTL